MRLNFPRTPAPFGLSKRAQSGASLIEVLIAIVILSFGILALANMQVFAVAANQNALAQGIAASMAADFADMMRANPAAFGDPNIGGKYDLAVGFDGSTTVSAVPDNASCKYPDCNAVDLAAFEVAMMKTRLRAYLRGGTFALVRPITDGVVSATQGDLWIMWTERRNAGSAATESKFDKCPEGVVGNDPKPRCFYMRVSL